MFYLTALIAGLGCGSSTAPRSDLAGRWTGATASYSFTVLLVDDHFKTATGTATVGPWTYLQLVAIETDPNRITLDLEAAQSPSLFLTGTLSGNTMRVSVDGGPFHGDSLTLTRQ